jgi:hypothetical protein
MLTDHGKNRSDILNVAKMHGVINTAFNCMKKQLGTLPGGINQHILLMPDIKRRINENTGYEQ